jgi:ATP-binding protein involved in chromosome partitioning
MRYAIPVSDGIVALHFGHCESFALIDADEQTRTISKKELVSAPAHQPGLLPGWLAEQGVSVVLAGGMGSRAQGFFQQQGIEVIIGVNESDPEKAVLSYMNGQLVAGENICDH